MGDMSITSSAIRGKTLGTAFEIIIVILLLASAASALSSSGGGTWQYFRDIIINNTGSAALSDYQVMVNLTGAAFPARANASGADIRFEQGGAELNYWFEKWDYANASALVWVNVTDVPVGASVVRMWYGNEKTEAVSDVNRTFIIIINRSVVSLSMDEGFGVTAYDNSGNGNYGALVNGPTWVNGKFGKGLSFDGSNDYVETTNLTAYFDLRKLNSKPWTLSFWAKSNASNIQSFIFSQSAKNHDAAIKLNLEELSLNAWVAYYLYEGGKETVVSHTFIDNNYFKEWHEYILTKDEGNSVKIYVDGDFKNNGTPSKNVMNSISTLRIGGQYTDVNRFWNGTIDEVHIYNRTLSASEISDLHNNYGYSTTNYPSRVLVRKYTSPEPTVANLGAEILTGPVHNINTGINYTTIQSAIDNASAGDEIHVDSGTYNENVIVNKQLILRGIDIGSGMPVVDARGMGNAITLTAGDVVLDGFNAYNSSSNNGIEVGVFSSNNVITNNNISKNFYGIHLASSGNTLANNTVIQSTNRGIFMESSPDNILINNSVLLNNDGIFLFYSGNNTITDNRVMSNSNDAITFDNSGNNTVINNNVSFNTRNGIYLYTSGGNTFTNNILISNNYGFSLGYSDNNAFTSNTAVSNTNGGIYMSSSHNTAIINNIYNNNGWGIFIEYSNNNTISGNEAILNNNTGISFGHSANNTITNNNASSNGQSGINMNSAAGNALTNNKLISNDYGIDISESDNNAFTGNEAILNTYGGIRLSSSDNNSIIDNIENKNGWGIYLGASGNNTITGNVAISNNNTGISLDNSGNNKVTDNNASSNGGNGIYMSSAGGNTLMNNILISNNYGINIDQSNNNAITGNSAISSILGGIYLAYSSNNTIINNTEYKNGWGMWLGNSSNNTIKDNQAISNTYSGVTLSGSSDNILINNNASSNGGAGIYAWSSVRNTFKDSFVSSNGYGFSLDSSDINTLINNNVSLNTVYGITLYHSSNNSIYNNIFKNTNNALDDGNNIWNTTKIPGTNIIGGSYLGGNYWSDYTGSDLNGDGLGDTLLPYNTHITNGGDYLPLMSHRINININGVPIIGVSTSDIMNVEYLGFSSGDDFNISVIAPNGSHVYDDNGSLTDADIQIIPVDWTPSEIGSHDVQVRGKGTVFATTVYVSNSAVVSPVPELSTLFLTFSGLMATMLISRRYRGVDK